MNEHDLTTLLDRSSGRLTPDIARLTSAASAQGHRSLRRRRGVLGLGTAVVVGAVAGGAILLPSPPGDEDPAREDLPVAVDPRQEQAPATPEQRSLATPRVVADRLVAMLDGTVTDVEHELWPGKRPSLRVSLLLDGAAVTAYVYDATPGDPATVMPPGPKPAGCDPTEVPGRDGVTTINEMVAVGDRMREDPAFARCVEWVTSKSEYDCAQDVACWGQKQWGDNQCRTEPSVRKQCTRLPDGGWAWSGSQPIYTHEGPDRPTDLMESFGRVYAADHWEIQLTALNSAGEKEGPALSEEPVLSADQLAAIAGSDIWFE